MVIDPDRVRYVHNVASRGSVNCGVAPTPGCWRSSRFTLISGPEIHPSHVTQTPDQTESLEDDIIEVARDKNALSKLATTSEQFSSIPDHPPQDKPNESYAVLPRKALLAYEVRMRNATFR